MEGQSQSSKSRSSAPQRRVEEHACLPLKDLVSPKKSAKKERRFSQPLHPLSTPLQLDLEARDEPSGSQVVLSAAQRTPLETIPEMPAAYAVRDGGDAKSKKQSMADLKLRRLQELNSRLKEDLDRPRIRVSEAAASLVAYCNNTRDYMVPSVWGQIDRKDDPYNPQSAQSEGCCSVM